MGIKSFMQKNGLEQSNNGCRDIQQNATEDNDTQHHHIPHNNHQHNKIQHNDTQQNC